MKKNSYQLPGTKEGLLLSIKKKRKRLKTIRSEMLKLEALIELELDVLGET